MDAGEFFDENYEFYNKDLNHHDHDFLMFIKNNKNRNGALLDVGGGSGNFSKLVVNNFPDFYVTIIDPSRKLLSRIDNPKINKIIGKLPDDISLNRKYDYIHMKEVLHHIIGKTVSDSNNLLKDSLNSLKPFLNEEGYLMINELYYEGFLFPKLPSYIIFYLLLLQRKFNLKIPSSEFIVGLQVYFYTRKELKLILEECGFEIVEYKTTKWRSCIKKNILLIKNWGRVLIVAKKIK